DGRTMASVVWREFRLHPAAVMKIFALKLARSWYGTDSRRKEGLILLIQIGYLALISWGGWRAWKLGGIHRTFAAGAILIALYFWSMTFLVLSILRYMVPAMGVLFVLMAACLRFGETSRKAV